MRRITVLTTLLGVLAVTIYLVGRDRGSNGATADGATAQSESHTSPEGAKRTGDPPPAPIGPPDQQQAREGIPASALSGRLVSSDGVPIPNALLSWTALTVEDIEWEPCWQRDDWGPLERQTSMTGTDSDGRFRFQRSPADGDSRGSVLWATHPEYLADVRFLEAESSPALEDWSLKPGVPVRVRVLSEAGAPIAGATVDHFGTTPSAAPNRAPERLRRLLQRTAQTDAEGLALLGSFPGEQVIVASHGGARSVPRRALPGAKLDIHLMPTFTVEGTNSLPSWEHLDYVGERRLVVAAQKGNVFQTLASVRHIQPGPYGPIELPIPTEAARLRVRLEGSPIIPQERMLPPPSPGERVRIDMAAELGHDVWFYAENDAGETLFDAVARVWWRDPEFPHEWKSIERRARPDSGEISVWSLPDGWIKYEVHAPGYTPYYGDDIELPMKEPYTVSVTLHEAGRIRGRVVHQGDPVEDFEVAVWLGQSEHIPSFYPFIDREDGSFEIDEVWAGNVGIVASSTDLPSCVPKRVEVAPGETVEVLLELPTPLSGHGRIIDARTGEPVPDALVSLTVRGASRPLGPWGPARAAGHDGTFRVDGLAEGANSLSIRARNYAALVTSVICQGGGTSEDLGTFALQRPQELEFRLLGAGGFEGFRLQADGPEKLPIRAFPADGVLVIEDVGPGWYMFRLTYPDESVVTLARELVVGESWRIEKLVRGGRTLTVEPVAEDPDELEKLGSVLLSYRSERGYFVQWPREPASRHPLLYEFDAIDADSVQAKIFDRRYKEVAAAQGDLHAGNLHLVVPIDRTPVVIRVVDADLDPIANVTVAIQDPGDSSVYLQATTGEAGDCELHGVPEKPLEVSLFHRTQGSRLRIPWDGHAREATLTLAASGSIELQMLDHDEPVQGVSCALLLANGLASASVQTSGADGRVRFERLAPGPCQVRCWSAEHWSVDADAVATDGPATTPVQIRRLGSVELLVTRGGLPVSGQRIELLSTEFAESVGGWIAAGRIAGPEELATDLQGRVRLEGLPHGPYSWAIALADGTSAQGGLVVLPGRELRVPILLP